MSAGSIEDAFASAIREAGLGDAVIPADSKFHRFKVPGDKSGQRTGWAVLHGDGVPHGAAGDWRSGERITWRPRGAFGSRQSQEIRAADRRRREADQQRQAAVAEKAAKLWERLPAAPGNHAYLVKKQITPGPCKITNTNSVVVPVSDVETGEIITLQFIREDGSKRFLAGGRVAGGCCILGDLDGDHLVVAEGIATAASIRLVTGWPVVAALSKDNLMAVANAMRARFPDREIVVAADNDAKTKSNPGITKATEAAKAIGASVAIPPEPGDWNDLHVNVGTAGTREIFLARLEAVRSAKAETKDEIDADAEIKRLAALDPITYERERKAAAKRLGIDRMSVLDKLVTAAQSKDDKGKMQGEEIELLDPVPWPEPVDGEQLLDQLAASVAEYVVLPIGGADVVALWAAHAHCVSAFYYSPRLDIGSPTRGCGKTTLLDWLEKVSPRGIRSESVTTAVIFRLIHEHAPTLLVDEVDNYVTRDPELIAAINAGHRRGGMHMRCEGDGNVVRGFRTFGPVALAGIGRLPATIADRSIALRLRKATKDEARRLKPFRADRAEHLDFLCRKLARWALDNSDSLAALDSAVPVWMFNRQADNWRVLFAIADAVGGAWPERARKAALLLASASADEEEAAVQALIDIRDLFTTRDADRLASEEIVDALVAMEGRPWAEWGRQQKPMTKNALARLLKRFEIQPGTIRLDDGRTPKGYTLNQFSEAFRSYIPADLPSQPPHRHNPQESRGNGQSQSATPDPHVADEKPMKPADSLACGGVADETPPEGGREHIIDVGDDDVERAAIIWESSQQAST